MSQIIMRPVFNRPEMLYLSIEYEKAAREYYDFPYDLLTVFVVEHKSNSKVLELVESYPFKNRVVQRPERYGLTKSILLGFKEVFAETDDFVIHLEDDVLLHKTYFQYMDILLNMFSREEYTILSPFNQNDHERVDRVYRGHHYAALAPLIDKGFFENYVEPCITETYYENFNTRNKFCHKLAENYKDNPLYKYRDNPGMHNEQAGLINKLVDVALIEEGKHTISPYVNRQQHIGYFGKNRPGGKLPGVEFEERVANLREIMKDPRKMFEFSNKQYDDYLAFSPKLEEWDGTLKLGRD